MSIADLSAYLNACRIRVEKRLESFFKEGTAPWASRLDAAMVHSLLGGGKRLRPILCVAAAQAIVQDRETALDRCLDVACALEMIHTYSLIHDDLPAMDNDDLRRGRPTCHRAFDEATAILAGDALQALAFEVLASFGKNSHNPLLGLSLVVALARASGNRGMVAGQMLDLSAEGQMLNLEDLEKLHRLKTGALIEVSVWSGGVLGGASVEEIQALSTYGRHLGLAFQVTDDLLDVTGDPAVMGKTAGSDVQNHKATYPSLLGMAKAQAMAEELIQKSLDALEAFGPGADPLRAIAAYVLERKQ
jgi:geranylgeranyl diphosphate synthase type II